MRELVGLEPAAELRVLLSALFLVVLFASPLLTWFALLGPRGRPASWLALGVAVLAGCALSLAWMRLDERAFDHEVQVRGVDQLQSRPRWWPNDTGALVWAPGFGVHATD
jgi:hypothetical protein